MSKKVLANKYLCSNIVLVIFGCSGGEEELGGKRNRENI